MILHDVLLSALLPRKTPVAHRADVRLTASVNPRVALQVRDVVVLLAAVLAPVRFLVRSGVSSQTVHVVKFLIADGADCLQIDNDLLDLAITDSVLAGFLIPFFIDGHFQLVSLSVWQALWLTHCRWLGNHH